MRLINCIAVHVLFALLPTVLVGTARRLAAETDTWQGTLMLVAQPAEERGAGGRQMLADGLFERFPRPDYNLTLHASAELPEDLLPEVRIKDEYTPSVYNDAELVDRVVSVLNDELGESGVKAVPPAMIGEDFVRYGRTEPPIPSMLFWLGAVDPDRYSAAMNKGEILPALHSPLFAPLPEPAIETGVRAFTALARNLLFRQ